MNPSFSYSSAARSEYFDSLGVEFRADWVAMRTTGMRRNLISLVGLTAVTMDRDWWKYVIAADLTGDRVNAVNILKEEDEARSLLGRPGLVFLFDQWPIARHDVVRLVRATVVAAAYAAAGSGPFEVYQ